MDLVIENKIAKPDEQYDQDHRNEEHRICSSRTISIPCTQVHEIQAEQSQSKDDHCKDKFLRRLIMNVAWIDEAKPARTIDQRSVGLDKDKQSTGGHEGCETDNEDHRQRKQRPAGSGGQLYDAHPESEIVQRTLEPIHPHSHSNLVSLCLSQP